MATKTDAFIATLHVIAAGEAPTEDLQRAVWVVFTRYLQEAEAPLGNEKAVAANVAQLQEGLTAAKRETNSARFETLRSYAHGLAAEWLRTH